MLEVFSAQGKMIQTGMHKFSHNKIAQLQNEDKLAHGSAKYLIEHKARFMSCELE